MCELEVDDWDEWFDDAVDEVDRRDCCGCGLFQLVLRISTFDDFHRSEFGGKIAFGSINDDATINFVCFRGYVFLH